MCKYPFGIPSLPSQFILVLPLTSQQLIDPSEICITVLYIQFSLPVLRHLLCTVWGWPLSRKALYCTVIVCWLSLKIDHKQAFQVAAGKKTCLQCCGSVSSSVLPSWFFKWRQQGLGNVRLLSLKQWFRRKRGDYCSAIAYEKKQDYYTFVINR